MFPVRPHGALFPAERSPAPRLPALSPRGIQSSRRLPSSGWVSGLAAAPRQRGPSASLATRGSLLPAHLRKLFPSTLHTYIAFCAPRRGLCGWRGQRRHCAGLVPASSQPSRLLGAVAPGPAWPTSGLGGPGATFLHRNQEIRSPSRYARTAKHNFRNDVFEASC